MRYCVHAAPCLFFVGFHLATSPVFFAPLQRSPASHPSIAGALIHGGLHTLCPPWVRPSVSVRGTFDVPRSVARLICIGRVVGALLACGRRLSLPSRRLPAFPQRRQALQRLTSHTRRPRSSVCANARRNGVRAPLRSRSPRHASLLRLPLRGLPRFPSALVRSATLRARNANQRKPAQSVAVRLISVGRVSRVGPLRGCLRSRVNKEKVRTT